MKRLLDIVVGLCALALLSPILVLAALAVLLESGRPVLFRQRRVGLGGREFSMVKFRSMVRDASARGPYHTSENDPRITRVGHILRRTSIDELPQLLNVLLGDMSLVGPRPDVPAQRSLYTPQEWKLRCSVRPGITGLAQARLRSSATREQRTALDLEYASRAGVWLDLKIMAMTVVALVKAKSN
jgi:lipopolysaccharide/colanic/teichoic acid biosynthesis glycosyltransferase